LGRALHGVDLLPHQSAYLDHLVELVRTEVVDAVLVSGDVYDRAVPPVEAVDVLNDALRRLAALTHVVLISGNHDSAIRLGFGAGLMRPQIHLVTDPRTVGTGLAIPRAAGGTGLVYAIPFLDVDAARVTLAPDATVLARSHEAVLTAAMDRIRADLATRTATDGPRDAVVLAHAFVIGGAGSESERDIRVGGVDVVAADVFAGVDYVALGHLHGPQALNAGPTGPVLRYSGSPLAYSFSELSHTKSTALVTTGDGQVTVEPIPAPVPRPLGDVVGPLEELLSRVHDDVADHWLRVTVTDPVRPATMNAQVRRRFPHALVIQHVPIGVARPGAAPLVSAARAPEEVAVEFVEFVGGGDVSAAERAVLRAAVEAVGRAERGA
jgi:exonuclease SbcD